jgi:rubrerythrin
MEVKYMNKKKLQCNECGYYWEIYPSEKLPQNCPVCNSNKIHRSTRHKRFAKKSRPKVRRSVTFFGGRI